MSRVKSWIFQPPKKIRRSTPENFQNPEKPPKFFLNPRKFSKKPLKNFRRFAAFVFDRNYFFIMFSKLYGILASRRRFFRVFNTQESRILSENKYKHAFYFADKNLRR